MTEQHDAAVSARDRVPVGDGADRTDDPMAAWSCEKTAATFDGNLPPPTWVNIETTRFCNLACRMCIPALSGTTKEGPHLDLDRFRRYAEQIFPYAEVLQPSVSGEPMLTRGFAEMVETAASYGLKIDMVTNGTILSDRLLETMTPHLGRITFSIDGATKETFEAVRIDANFDQVLRNVRRWVAAAQTILCGSTK